MQFALDLLILEFVEWLMVGPNYDCSMEGMKQSLLDKLNEEEFEYYYDLARQLFRVQCQGCEECG